MKHYLTFKDDKSNKFWQIEVSGKSFTVMYGKTGSAGTTQEKKFASENECIEAAEKLLAEKKKKGYSSDVDLPKSPAKTAELSVEFFNYMKGQLAGVEKKSVAQKLSRADWNALAENVFNRILQYWAKLKNDAKEQIGSFVIGWNDGEDNGIDIDYVESNDVSFYADGASANMASNVVDFSGFFKSVLKSDAEEIQDEDFFGVVKDLLCKLTQEMVQATVYEDVFLAISKKSPFKVWFYYWHDEDMIEIYDSEAGKLPIQDYNVKEEKQKGADRPLKSFFNYGRITIKGEIPANIAKAAKALSAKIETNDECLPPGFALLRDLGELDIKINSAKIFPVEITKLTALERLSVEASLVASLPDDLGNLKNLKRLSIEHTQITQPCNGISQLKKLEKLQLQKNKNLIALSSSIGALENLRDLSISDCDLQVLDESVYNLRQLRFLGLSRTMITNLSEGIDLLSNLQSLWINGTNISSLPDSIFKLKKLSFISISNSKITDETAREIVAKFKAEGRTVEVR